MEDSRLRRERIATAILQSFIRNSGNNSPMVAKEYVKDAVKVADEIIKLCIEKSVQESKASTEKGKGMEWACKNCGRINSQPSEYCYNCETRGVER